MNTEGSVLSAVWDQWGVKSHDSWTSPFENVPKNVALDIVDNDVESKLRCGCALSLTTFKWPSAIQHGLSDSCYSIWVEDDRNLSLMAHSHWWLQREIYKCGMRLNLTFTRTKHFNALNHNTNTTPRIRSQ